ncbi:MAG: FAD-binding oxidoreductase [Myxococcales bacterium]
MPNSPNDPDVPNLADLVGLADRAASTEPAATATPDRLVPLEGWGRVPQVLARELLSEDLAGITAHVPLSRGLGRSYGDSSLPGPGDQTVAGSVRADRILGFDPQTAVLRAESGLSLRELIRLLLPRGFFTPVTPGTQFVTLGGMVAADVHGKNHHRDGCFGQHVLGLRMRVADGRIIHCSPTEEAELFRATVGGMGLTGHILEVTVQLKKVPSPWIVYESVRLPDVDAYVAALKEAGLTWPMTVGFLDCTASGAKLGRGVLIKGRWAEAAEAPEHPPVPKHAVNVPFDFPSWVLNPLSIRILNALGYHKHGRKVRGGIMHPEAYFYPLDKLRHWNRFYGARGMTQFQCVLPDSAGPGAARRFLELMARHRAASPVCVVKDCGAEGLGMLSFPRPGITIAVDFPVRDGTQALIDALNEHVIKEGGRIYLAKDAFTRPEHFRAMEPRLEAWETVRRKWDPEGKIRSRQSVRMLGDAASRSGVLVTSTRRSRPR